MVAGCSLNSAFDCGGEGRQTRLTYLAFFRSANRVGIIFEYRDQEAHNQCQKLLEEHYLPAVEGLTTKVVGSRGVVVHEFISENYNN